MTFLLRSWVDFTNTFTLSFLCADSKSAKSQQCLFALVGYARSKAARKTIMKLTPNRLFPLPT